MKVGNFAVWRLKVIYVWYKSDELECKRCTVILGKDVCTDVCSMLMCKYTCVLDYVNVDEYVMGKRKMIQ